MDTVSKSVSRVLSVLRTGNKNLEGLFTLGSRSHSLLVQRIQDCDSISDMYTWIHELSLVCEDQFIVDPDWLLVAGRIKMSYIADITPPTFSGSCALLDRLLYPSYAQFVSDHASKLDALIHDERDYDHPIAAIDTLMQSYLLRLKKKGPKPESGSENEMYDIVERPQYMWMRVAVFLWHTQAEEKGLDLVMDHIQRTYTELSLHQYMHATPTLFNAGLYKPSLTSCFTLDVEDDTGSIAQSWKNLAFISKGCGGVGVSYSSLRHSEISQRAQNTDLMNWMKITEEIMKTFNQGNKRKGSAAVFLSIWHIDVEKFIDSRRGTDNTANKTRDLFNGLWIHDEFMRRVRDDQSWTLFCPHTVPGLDRLWGDEFTMAYRKFEQRAREGLNRYHKVVKARHLFLQVLNAQIESGAPYMLYADAANRKSNQANIGPIVTSNLCTEILLHTSPTAIGSCNLSNLVLQKHVRVNDDGVPYYHFQALHDLTRYVVRTMDRVIDMTYYEPMVPEIESTNKANRPLGIGVQGLADTFAMMDYAWESSEAATLNRQIFETIYHACIQESIQLAKEYGAYPNFKDSPASRGLFQFDLWNLEQLQDSLDPLRADPVRADGSALDGHDGTLGYDWDTLRTDMKTHGLRHSLLVALMPTASTSTIVGSCECIEPMKQCIYMHDTLSGRHPVVNQYCIRELMDIQLWNESTLNSIWANQGSIQYIDHSGLDSERMERLHCIKEKYKTAYEIKQRVLLNMAVERGRYICQSQSLNCFLAEPNLKKLYAYHMEGWSKKLKTGMYYLRQLKKVIGLNYGTSALTVKSPEDSEKLNQEPESTRASEAPLTKPKMVCTDDVCIVCQ